MPDRKKSGIEEAAEEADRRERADRERVKGMTKEELERDLLNQYKVTEVYRAASNALITAVREQVAGLKKAGVKNLPVVPKAISGKRDMVVAESLAAIISTTENSTITTIEGLRKRADAYDPIVAVLRDMYNTIFKNPGVWMEKEVYKKFQEEIFKKIGFDPNKEYNPEGASFPNFVIDYLKAVTLTGGDYKAECTRLAPIVETIQAKLKKHPGYEAAKKKVKQNVKK